MATFIFQVYVLLAIIMMVQHVQVVLLALPQLQLVPHLRISVVSIRSKASLSHTTEIIAPEYLTAYW